MSTASLGGIVTGFLECDDAGEGRIDEERLIQALRRIHSFYYLDSGSKQPDGGANEGNDRFKQMITLANASSDEGVNYATFLGWLLRPGLVEMQSSATPFIKRLTVSKFGVLGTFMALDNGMVKNEKEPDANTAFVDPAGLHHVRHGNPGNADGAAGVIYKWLGITDLPAFPDDVVAAMNAPLTAKFHAYGEKKCIHVIGPDFRKRDYTEEEGIFELAACYYGMLREFVLCGLPVLRLLPVSGGIFSGPFLPRLPKMTFQALHWGFVMLSPDEQKKVLAAERLELCIFMEKELPDFTAAFNTSLMQMF